MTEPRNYTHIWKWSKLPCSEYGKPGKYKGMLCRILVTCSPKKNKAEPTLRPAPRNYMIEFENGEIFIITSGARRFAMKSIGE